MHSDAQDGIISQWFCNPPAMDTQCLWSSDYKYVFQIPDYVPGSNDDCGNREIHKVGTIYFSALLGIDYGHHDFQDGSWYNLLYAADEHTPITNHDSSSAIDDSSCDISWVPIPIIGAVIVRMC